MFIGGFSGRKKEELARKLQRHDEETAKVYNEKRAIGEDFGECEQYEDLSNIKHVMKPKFKCTDCKLRICGPCEITHIKTKATRHHNIEHLHQLNLLQHPLPEFARVANNALVKTLIKMNIKKHLAKTETFDFVTKHLHDRENRINRIVFNMPSSHGPIKDLEAIARATKC